MPLFTAKPLLTVKSLLSRPRQVHDARAGLPGRCAGGRVRRGRALGQRGQARGVPHARRRALAPRPRLARAHPPRPALVRQHRVLAGQRASRAARRGARGGAARRGAGRKIRLMTNSHTSLGGRRRQRRWATQTLRARTETARTGTTRTARAHSEAPPRAAARAGRAVGRAPRARGGCVQETRARERVHYSRWMARADLGKGFDRGVGLSRTRAAVLGGLPCHDAHRLGRGGRGGRRGDQGREGGGI